MSETLVIDVWSDVVCPFCYLGTRQLSSALENFEFRDHVTLRHRAFELDANAPSDYGLSLNELLAKKYGMSVERARGLNDRMEREAKNLGMEWSLNDARPTNTFDAHRLLALGSTQGRDEILSELLFHAYFSEGRLLSDRDTLRDIAQSAGLSDIDSAWSNDAFAQVVRSDENTALELGITGVPSLLVDEKFMIVGAQGSEHILDVLNRAWARRAA
jgi:predicted DsbA family dithiol-disulfide isomerase